MKSEKIIKIILDDQNKTKQKFDIDCTLSEARNKLNIYIKNKFLFLDNEKFIVTEDLENDQKISDILLEDKMFLKSKNKNQVKEEININIKPKNMPLPEAILLKEEGKMKIYQYPQIEFTNNEESKEILY